MNLEFSDLLGASLVYLPPILFFLLLCGIQDDFLGYLRRFTFLLFLGIFCSLFPFRMFGVVFGLPAIIFNSAILAYVMRFKRRSK